MSLLSLAAPLLSLLLVLLAPLLRLHGRCYVQQLLALTLLLLLSLLLRLALQLEEAQ